MTKYQRYSSSKTALATVPKVRLYVERPEEKQHWFVHIGHVTDRGRWRTEPHAHPDYGQVVFVRQGRGVINLEGSNVPFEGPCALVLPTECVHGMDYEIDADRWVVTIEVAYLTQVNAKLHEFIQLWSVPRMVPLAHNADEFADLIGRLQHEVSAQAPGHVVGTEALLTSLLLMLVRGVGESLSGADAPEHDSASRGEIRLAERFRELIDLHYRDNWQLQDYASKLGASLVQLRAACAAASGHSPAKLIHARIITEAKRHLIFGDMSMEQIAFALGFTDAAYFTRFFRKEVGQAPSQFRLAARQQP